MSYYGAPNQSGYPQQPGGYPPQQPGGYPAQPGYPPQQPGYPPQQPGYPAQQPGYPAQPPQQGGYPPQQPAYLPNAQGATPGYGAPPGGPPQQQPYAPGASVQPVNPSAPTAYPPVVAPAPAAPYQQPLPNYQGQSIHHAAAQSSLLAGNVGVGLPQAPTDWSRKGTNPKIQISLSANKLTDRDLTSKSDPLAVIFMYDVPTKRWYEAGRTEAIRDNLNPEWAQKIDVDYFFEEEQKMRIEVYDKDANSAKLKHHDFLGKTETKLSAIISAKGSRKTLDLKTFNTTFKIKSTITVSTEQKSTCRDIYSMRFSAKKLDDKDFFGKSDPYIEISRLEQSGNYSVVHRTEVINNNLNPTWREFEIEATRFNNGDRTRQMRFRIYDWDSDGSSDLIGEFFTNMDELQSKYRSKETFTVVNEKKKKKKGSKYKGSGFVSITNLHVAQGYSFLDYIGTGYGSSPTTQLNFIVAIDYTGSNGDPREPSSLHYFNPHNPSNQYTNAIGAVGNIIQEYDTDKLFPTYGFGAKLSDGQIHFCFNVNLTHDCNCAGVDGILHAYKSTMPMIQLWGPTNFTPVINQAAGLASQSVNGSAYYVLLILTDGAITDFPETKDAIVRASGLPLSIIIVGVGNADFSAMSDLDSDGKVMKSPLTGQGAERDIVQFVPFRQFIGSYGGDFGMSSSRLAKEVLAEVPTQFEHYMRRRGIKPIG